MTAHVITCADHSDSAVLNCDAYKAALHALTVRARRAGLPLTEQAIAEGARLLRLRRPVAAAHRLRLVWRAQVEQVSA